MLGAVAALGRRMPGRLRDGPRRRPRSPGRSAASRPSSFCGMGGSAVAGDVLRTRRSATGCGARRGQPGAGAARLRRTATRSSSCPPISGAPPRRSRRSDEALGARLPDPRRHERRRRSRRACARARDRRSCRVPGGVQPRAALGHLAFAMLGALEAAGLLPARSRTTSRRPPTSLEDRRAGCGPSVPPADERREAPRGAGSATASP